MSNVTEVSRTPLSQMRLDSSPDVEKVFSAYPDSVRDKLLNLRRFILEAAAELELETLEETLKWGEPSYLARDGSTVRIDWKEKTPRRYAIYFKCTSKLVTTFKEVYKDTFRFEGTRATVFELDDKVPEVELKECISAALIYHKVKQLPRLGL